MGGRLAARALALVCVVVAARVPRLYVPAISPPHGGLRASGGRGPPRPPFEQVAWLGSRLTGSRDPFDSINQAPKYIKAGYQYGGAPAVHVKPLKLHKCESCRSRPTSGGSTDQQYMTTARAARRRGSF
jgi:hypothetical protein